MTQLWVISTVKGREKKEKKKLLAGRKKKKKIRKHQPGRKPKKSSDKSRVNECFKKMGRIGGKC